MRVTSVTFTVRTIGSTAPGPPLVTSTPMVTVTPLAAAAASTTAVVAIVGVGSA